MDINTALEMIAKKHAPSFWRFLITRGHDLLDLKPIDNQTHAWKCLTCNQIFTLSPRMAKNGPIHIGMFTTIRFEVLVAHMDVIEKDSNPIHTDSKDSELFCFRLRNLAE